MKTLKLRRIVFIESVRQGVTKRNLADDLRDLDFTVSQTENQYKDGLLAL